MRNRVSTLPYAAAHFYLSFYLLCANSKMLFHVKIRERGQKTLGGMRNLGRKPLRRERKREENNLLQGESSNLDLGFWFWKKEKQERKRFFYSSSSFIYPLVTHLQLLKIQEARRMRKDQICSSYNLRTM